MGQTTLVLFALAAGSQSCSGSSFPPLRTRQQMSTTAESGSSSTFQSLRELDPQESSVGLPIEPLLAQKS